MKKVLLAATAILACCALSPAAMAQSLTGTTNNDLTADSVVSNRNTHGLYGLMATGSPTGLNIQMPSPTLLNGATSIPGVYKANSIDAAIDVPVSGPGPQKPDCACVVAFGSHLQVGPGYNGYEARAGGFGVTTTGDSLTYSDLVGVSAGVNQQFKGNSRLYGASTSATVGPNGASPFEIGHEVDVSLSTATGVPYRSGFNVVGMGTNKATTVDAALSLECAGGTENKGGCFHNMFALEDAGGRLNPPIDADGSLFVSESPLTIKHVFDFHNVNITGDIWWTPNTIMTGTGDLVVSSVRAYGVPPQAPQGQVIYGGKTVAPSYCGSLKGAVGCVVINVDGTQRYMPYW